MAMRGVRVWRLGWGRSPNHGPPPPHTPVSVPRQPSPTAKPLNTGNSFGSACWRICCASLGT
eukprot:4610830-Prymnesium_polylepis.2